MTKPSAGIFSILFVGLLSVALCSISLAQPLPGQLSQRRLIRDKWNPPSANTDATPSEASAAESSQALAQSENAEPEFARRWQSVPGPETGTVDCFLVKGSRVYAGTSGGVFVSENRGRSWRRTGIGFWRQVFTLLDTGDAILAGVDAFGGGNFGSQPGGLWRSRDGGVTWQPYGQGLPDGNAVNSLTKVGTTIFASVYTPATFMPTVYRSTDNGAHWQLANQGLPAVFGLLLTGSTSSIMAWTDQGLYRSDATGSQWDKVDLYLPANASISYGIFPAASNDNYFIATSAGVYVSNDAGKSWYASNYGLPAGAGARDVGIYGDTVYTILENGDLYTSATFGAVWELRSAGYTLGRDDIGIIQLGDILLTASHGNGVFRSTDQGAQWNASNNGLSAADVLSPILALGKRLYVAANGGVWMSRNKGETWTLQNKGLPQLPYANLTAATMGIQGRTLYVGLTSGGVYASHDFGNSWELVGGGLPADLYPLFIKSMGSKLYVGSIFAGLWVSEDRGQTWKLITALPSDTFYTALTRYCNTLLVGTYGNGVYRSDDDGQTWRQFNDGLRDSSLPVDDFDVYNNILTVGTDDSIYRLKADGSGWEEHTDYATTIKGGIDYFGRVGRTLYASTYGRGVAVSYDNGETWTKLNDGLTTRRFYAFAVIDDDLFVGSLGNGLFRLRNAGNARHGALEE